MNINTGKATIVILLFCILAVAGYWYWSPFLAIRQIQTAAKAGDADAFNDKVDYPKLRESFKGQFGAILSDKVGANKDSNNPFSALGGMLGMAMIDKVVDAMVRPETVMKGMQEGRFGPIAKDTTGDSSGSPGTNEPKKEKPEWSYDRKSADKLIAYPKDATQSEETFGLVFERNGFANWKLTEIRLPSQKK